MQLVIIRHAIAEDAAEGQEDASRKLTDKGKKRFKKHVQALSKLGFSFDRVLHSPYRRAVQTAKLCKPLAKNGLTETELLAKEPSRELLKRLSEADDCTAVIGHQPWLSELAGWMCFNARTHGQKIALKKGGVIVLEGVAKGRGMTLIQALSPAVLRSL